MPKRPKSTISRATVLLTNLVAESVADELGLAEGRALYAIQLERDIEERFQNDTAFREELLCENRKHGNQVRDFVYAAMRTRLAELRTLDSLLNITKPVPYEEATMR